MDKEEIEVLFASIDSHMTELFHSGLTGKQIALVQTISKDMAKLYNLLSIEGDK